MPPCPRCGREMVRGTAILTFADRCEDMTLPPTCPDLECGRAGQRERDEAALRHAIEAGVIDP